MPPKRVAKPKLHQLAPEIPVGTKFDDHTKKVFVLGKQIASGGFGRIYSCREASSKQEMVVKIEPQGNGPLFTEVNVFQRIFKPELISMFLKEREVAAVGVPPLISSGVFDYKNVKLRYLVMPMYGTSLESLRLKQKKFLFTTVFAIAQAVARSLEYIHSKNYTHGDVKAGNIVMTVASDFSNAVLIDYGLARMASSNVEKPEKKRAHNGTLVFTSLDAHLGLQPSYRGDIEILVYNMIYWLTGTLPWLENEGNPATVQAGKEKLKQGKELEKLLEKESEAVVSAIRLLYDTAIHTPYTQPVDFTSIHQALEIAIAPSRKTKKTSQPKAVPIRRGSSSIKKKSRVPKEDPEKSSANLRRSGRKRSSTSASVDSSSRPSSSSRDPSSAASTNALSRKASNGNGTRKRNIVPSNGVSAKRRTPVVESSAEGSSPDEESKEKERLTKNATKGKTAKNSKTPTKKPIKEKKEVKSDGVSLRKTVPGMRNLPVGRRSSLINRIAAKHSK